MRQFEATILGNRAISESWRELRLSWDPEAGRASPGRFFTLRTSTSFDPLLRRPLAFSAADDEGTEVGAVYQVRGGATRALAGLGPGSRLDVLGPLGTAFPGPDPGERPLLAAGGIGLGPMLFLARRLAERREGPAPVLAAGWRTAADLPALGLPEGTVTCTDDGTAGEKGTPLDWISRNAPSGPVRLYACGPAAMLAGLAALARARGWEASLLAEQWMACGVGACMGCVLPRPGGGYLRACADGPVFGRDEVDWEAEARRAGRAAAPGGGR